MKLKPKISRDTWFLHGKYLLRATARFIGQKDFKRIDIIEACALIFEGDPAITEMPPLFISETHVHSNDLEVALTEAERHGRIYIAELRQ